MLKYKVKNVCILSLSVLLDLGKAFVSALKLLLELLSRPFGVLIKAFTFVRPLSFQCSELTQPTAITE